MAITLPNPMRDVSKSRTVIARTAGSVSSSCEDMAFSTLRFASSGSHGSIESSSRSLAFFHQNHCRHCRDGLRDGSDAEDRVTLYGRRMAERHCAERLYVNVVMTTDERNQPRQLFTLNVSGQHLMHSREPRLRKTGGVHVQLLSHLAACSFACGPAISFETINK
jgi:hypothetical protein